jgi:hypothetical protein
LEHSEILRKITADLEHGELSFPSTARVALKLKRALDNPDCHLEEAARLIKTDPLLSTKVVALANSAALNASGRTITDVRSAAMRLGFRHLRSLACSMVVRELADNATPRTRELADALWKHTVHVASLAYVIARRVTRLDAETAFFAGLLHEIVGFYLISRAGDYPVLLEKDLGHWSEGAQAELGDALLTLLSVPDAVRATIADYWSGFLQMPPATLGDTLLLADNLAPVDNPLYSLEKTPRNDTRARISLLVNGEILREILEESTQETNSLVEALSY